MTTAVLGMIAFAVWALAYRATRDGIRAETVIVERERRDDGVTQALAEAIALLGTGTPASSPVSYIFVVGAPPDETSCTVIYTNTASKLWGIESRVATQAEIGTLPDAPASFS